MRCATCKEAITGRYVQAGRVAFHPEHFTCAGCQGAIRGNYVPLKGQAWHAECHAEAHGPRCGVCQRAIADQHLIVEGQAYHPRCYQTHLARPCDLCGQGIVGASLLNHWGHQVHASHRGKVAECRYCGRFISERTSGGGRKYEDGRTVCAICAKNGVMTERGARQIAEEIRVRLAGWGIEVPQVPLALVGRDQLARMLRGQGHALDKTNAFTSMKWEKAQGQVTRRDVGIYALYGMPRELFEGTMAHEYLHVWSFLRCGRLHAPPLEEGSCNYLKYLVHREQEGPQAEYQIACMLEDPDPAYGEGFRRAKRYAEKNGLPALLTLLERAGNFPLGY